jgi:hypothetical protein
MGNGETHRDTGRQRSEPEDGNHARQPEGRAGAGGRMARSRDQAVAANLLVQPEFFGLSAEDRHA